MLEAIVILSVILTEMFHIFIVRIQCFGRQKNHVPGICRDDRSL